MVDDALTPDTLDGILAIQCTVAWAGETVATAPRLGWWDCDLVDPDAGGDLFARLLPRTARWAALEAARDVARRADAAARAFASTPDRLLSLFHFGFHVDERLAEQLALHKRSGRTPDEVFGDRLGVRTSFSAAELESYLTRTKQKPDATVTPVGRRLALAPTTEPLVLAESFARALLPLDARYSLPYVQLA
jgi:hypothetical protein